MLRKIVIVIIVSLLSSNTLLYADTIHLKNGSKVEGIITKEDEESVQIKINIGATVAFSKEDIKSIERDSGDAHSEMKKSWEDEKAERKIVDVDIERNIEKGLVEYEGKWITPEKKERLQAADIAGGVKKEEKKRRFSFNEDNEKRSDFATKLLKKGKWFLKETEHFSIFYTDLAQAKIVSDKAEYYFEKIAYDLGYEGQIKWKTKCQVYIVESVDKW